MSKNLSKFKSLKEAISEYVSDGDMIAIEGFTHLIPFAAAHEIIRQGKTNLTAVRLTPDLVYDQLIGSGCISKVIFSFVGNPGVGSLHRFRDAYLNNWPKPLEIEEHTHAGLTNRYIAGASGLPFAILRGYSGSDLIKETKNIAFINSPFSNEQILAVAAINPDITIIHAQQADINGNVMLWGIVGSSKEAIFAAKKVIVTVEEIVDKFQPQFNSIIIPAVLINCVVLQPNGAWPSYASGYYERDNDQYIKWDVISKDRESFQEWLQSEIFAKVSL